MDSASRKLVALTPRGWLLVGLVALVPSFMAGGGATSASAGLAVSLGGILFAYRALMKLAQGVSTLSDATIAWRQVAELYHAASRPEIVGSSSLVAPPVAPGQPLISAHEVTFHYPGRGEPVLNGLRLEIAAGDRLLLEGSSGGGKSTLASLLIGLRTPAHGLLLCGGLDRASLGDGGWRRRIIAAPQFHENHVLCDTFAFNLLMGRNWPPVEQDLKDAWAICQELGLGPLLKRMPAGLFQTVGENGWQLSHGEKSRVFIARALLQSAELVILDESFAALDPETLELALRCVEKRAGTLLVIAHP
jgi:ATP-binding cassette subfamily B protein